MAKKSPEQGLNHTDVDINLFAVLAQIDAKNYAYWDTLTAEQQRKIVPYMLTHWMSTVQGQALLQRYYVLSVNAQANTHLFHENVQPHPQLQWLMLCAASPGMGNQRHQWIPHLNSGYAELKKPLRRRETLEYLEKVYKRDGPGVRGELADHLVQQQNHKYRLAQMYPEMKRADIELLAELVTEAELDEHDSHCGN